MDTLDETQIRDFVIKGDKLQAIKLVMQQKNMGLKEAKEYVDEFCLKEKIEGNYSGPSYSATNEGGSIVYYITENGEKHIISKEEAPEFLVNQMEKGNSRRDEKSSQQNNFPNHKKGRRILTIISLPFIFLGIFFLYQIFICKIYSFDNLGGAIACGVGIVGIYCIELILWLDETTARRRIKRTEEMEIPAAFIIKGKAAKMIVFAIDLCMIIVCILLLFVTVKAFLEKEYYIGIISFAVFLIGMFCYVPNFISYIKNSKLTMHISEKMVWIYKDNDEIAFLPAATSTCVFSCHTTSFDRKNISHASLRGQGPYPRAFLCNADGSFHAEIYLDLQEYHLLKKYLTQQGASVIDHYNHY